MSRSILLVALLAVACRKPGDFDGDGTNDDQDCSPGDPLAFPGAAEVCDGTDNDCNGSVDDAASAPTWYADVDADGFGDAAGATTACLQPVGATADATDCDDTDPATHPGADEDCDDAVDRNCDGGVGVEDGDADGVPACDDCDDSEADVFPGAEETCDGEDQDCDGVADDDASDAVDYAIDIDDDGHGNARFVVASCEPLDGYVPATAADDCDDLDGGTFPGAPEDCDGADNDCDGTIDDGATGKLPWYPDADEDGYGDAAGVVLACVRPDGFVGNDDDCADADPATNPAAGESCTDPVDMNCDGSVGNEDRDQDGTPACDDCDDTRSDVEPGSPELCDELDNDCDGQTDENAPTWYADLDGDAHGNDRIGVAACTGPDGYVTSSDDCDDLDATVFPGAADVCDGVDGDCDGAPEADEADADGDGFMACEGDCADTDPTRGPVALERCNGADDDCDGTTDETPVDAQTFYGDADGDGYGAAKFTESGCTAPSGYVGNDDDCNDLQKAAYPGATEACDGVDNDCDGDTDEGSATGAATFYLDNDGDGYGGLVTTKACAAPAGFTSKSGDCADGDAGRFPGASEICDGLDDDCDGKLGANEGDVDGDGWRACTDCDDTVATINKGAVETCNGKDDDCDSSTDENPVDGLTWYADKDGDKSGDATSRVLACSQPSGYVAVSGDCNDGDVTYRPGAKLACDGTDRNCDGWVDNDYDFDGFTAMSCGGKDCADNDPSLPDKTGACAYRDCEAAKLAGNNVDGKYSIDPDGGGGNAPFTAFCDMNTAGGGWTLVYAYTFTDYPNFSSCTNSVTPRPNWTAAGANNPISTTPPQSETDYNAISFAIWQQIGTEFLVKSNINHWVRCSPGTGSLVTFTNGTLSCSNVMNVASSCPNTAPTSFNNNSGGSGPYISISSLYYFWDAHNSGGCWPTHDPCGNNQTNQLTGVSGPRGAIYVK